MLLREAVAPAIVPPCAKLQDRLTPSFKHFIHWYQQPPASPRFPRTEYGLSSMAASALMTVMINAARKAGRSLSRDFGEVENLQVSVKGPADFVSAADDRAEEIIFRELRKARPTYSFLMEESGVFEGEDKDQRWIVDPLDGTTNFLHSMPLFSISIALERQGQLVAAVVYNPITDELFSAEKGKGAYVNDRRLRVAGRRSVTDALITTGIPHRGRTGHEGFMKDMKTVMPEVVGIRRTGSAALDLAWTAAGRFDVFWERGLKPWDVAAGIVLMREAGGQVIDIDGGDDPLTSGNVLAGNPQILKAFAPLVARKKFD